MISVPLQGKPLNMSILEVYAPTTDAKEAEADQFYEDLQDFLELIPKKKKSHFTMKNWNAILGSQVIPGVKANLALMYKMK